MPTKTEDGVMYHADAYLYVPDREKPSTWKLRYKENVGGRIKVTAAQLGRAAAALSSGGFRGNTVLLPEGVASRIKGKIRQLYRSIGTSPEDMPRHIAGEQEKEKADEAILAESVEKIVDLTEGPVFPDKVEIDEETGIIKNVAMLGPVSKNGRRYKPEVMAKAVAAGMYEGLPAYWDHSPEKGQARRVRDLGGEWRNVHFDEASQRVRGDLHILPKYLKDVSDIARVTPRQVAPSHVVEGKVKRVKENGKVFEDVVEITRGISVDLVVGAATVSSLLEGEEKMNINDLTIDLLKEQRPDLVDLLKETKEDNPELEKKVAELVEQNKALLKKAEDAEKKAEEATKLAESNRKLKAALEESVLPKAAQEELVALYEKTVFNEDQIKALVESQVRYLEKVTGKKLTKEKVDIPDEGDPATKKDFTLSEGLCAMAGIKKEDKKD